MTIDDLAKVIRLLQESGNGKDEVLFVLSVAREGPKYFSIHSWTRGKNFETGNYELRLG